MEDKTNKEASASPEQDYLNINRDAWNQRARINLQSAFYDVEGFLKGQSSLKDIELELLGDVRGKRILHLQCHFGQDCISLARLGARVTGVDLSDEAIGYARELAGRTGMEVKPGGQLVFAEFHPVVWMFDNDFQRVAYRYFNDEAIVETLSGTYADRYADVQLQSVSWNHGLGEVVNSLIKAGLHIQSLNEYDYSPFDCFSHTEEFAPGKFRIRHLENFIPMVYSIGAVKLR
jgi:hypothetical protein